MTHQNMVRGGQRLMLASRDNLIPYEESQSPMTYNTSYLPTTNTTNSNFCE